MCQISFKVHTARSVAGKRRNGCFGQFKERNVNKNENLPRCTYDIARLYRTVECRLKKNAYEFDARGRIAGRKYAKRRRSK